MACGCTAGRALYRAVPTTYKLKNIINKSAKLQSNLMDLVFAYFRQEFTSDKDNVGLLVNELVRLVNGKKVRGKDVLVLFLLTKHHAMKTY